MIVKEKNYGKDRSYESSVIAADMSFCDYGEYGQVFCDYGEYERVFCDYVESKRVFYDYGESER